MAADRSSGGPWNVALSRRGLLRGGIPGLAGLSLAGILRAQAAAEAAGTFRPRIRACILIFYYGGPSHLDTFDPKPDAPAEIRGEFQPIATSVPGVFVSEHLPRTAQVMHKVALVRSLHHGMRNHDSACAETLTGRMPLVGGDRENFVPPSPLDVFPSHGASLSYLRGRRPEGSPSGPGRLPVSHAALPFVIRNVVPVPGQGAGFLGSAWEPFTISGDPETRTYQAEMLRLPEELTTHRIARRKGLLQALDGHASVSGTAQAAGLEALYEKAFDLLDSRAIRRALEIEQEPESVRQRYGLGLAGGHGESGAAGAALGFARNLRGLNLLLARRLVEAGVPFVNVYDFQQQGQNWDSHADNFRQHREYLLPPADRGFAALIEDLDERGLLEETLVVALGEFGRTPRINEAIGRDHWPDCYCALLAGGGIQGGRVYGASDRHGAYPERDPVTPGDLAATIFQRFGVDPSSEIHDPTGRPWQVAEGRPLEALFA